MEGYRPGVRLVKTEQGEEIRACMVSEKGDCGIVFYDRDTGNEMIRYPFPENNRMGNVHFQTIINADAQKMSYLFYEEERLLADPYARGYAQKDVFGKQKDVSAYKATVERGTYDWGVDTFPQIPYEESILYCMHVRGFTIHPSSATQAPGTFAGVVEKIPYLKELGITTLELQPVYEFNELPVMTGKEQAFHRSIKHKMNYWGYTEGYYYTPKRSYAVSDDPCRECKDMIKALHENGMEVVLQFYFPQTFSRLEVAEVLRFWRRNYHVDGFRIKGIGLPLKELVMDAWLAGCKLFLDEMPYGVSVSEEKETQSYKWAVCRDDYMWKLRSFLRGDSAVLRDAVMCMNATSKYYGEVRYITNYYGFTLADLVSYERKHNEANGEENRDGAVENFSCNYGVEGKTNRKQVLQKRFLQMKNAMTLLMLSGGIPLFFMGDEFANTQQGNNNPYCQDNEMAWLDWGDIETNRAWYETVKGLIAFRKEYRLFHTASGWTHSDYKGCGYPDLSYHGSDAWLQNWVHTDRHVGMMYCGDYVEGYEGRFYYVGINMHGRSHNLALPTLPKDYEWRVILGDESLLQVRGRRKGRTKSVFSLEGKNIVVLEGYKTVT